MTPCNQFGRCDLVQRQITRSLRNVRVELVERPIMDAQNNNFEQIDHKTSRSICDAVGERLQQSMRPEAELTPRLRELVDELRRRDSELH